MISAKEANDISRGLSDATPQPEDTVYKKINNLILANSKSGNCTLNYRFPTGMPIWERESIRGVLYHLGYKVQWFDTWIEIGWGGNV